MKRCALILLAAALLMGCATTGRNPGDRGKSKGFEYVLQTKERVSITGYTGKEKDVVIPGRLGGKTVVAISGNAFRGKGLTSVTIPNSVTRIGDESFVGNQLTSVTIPAGVTEIGNRAFYNNRLTSVTIPNSVTEIGTFAFSRNQLTSVTISNSVRVLRGFENNQLTSITIPNSVRTLSGFANNRLTSVTIPSGVTEIGIDAFSGNRLTSVTIPNSVTSIGDNAFRNNRLTSVIIPVGVTRIGDEAFRNNQLTSVTIPSGVTRIGNSAFRDNRLTSVTIPNSVTEIGTFAFSGNQLTSVTIPPSVTSVGINAFSGNPLSRADDASTAAATQATIQGRWQYTTTRTIPARTERRSETRYTTNTYRDTFGREITESRPETVYRDVHIPSRTETTIYTLEINGNNFTYRIDNSNYTGTFTVSGNTIIFNNSILSGDYVFINGKITNANGTTEFTKR